jgi:hypothetical protein
MMVFPGYNEQNLTKIPKNHEIGGKFVIKMNFPKLKCTIGNNTS